MLSANEAQRTAKHERRMNMNHSELFYEKLDSREPFGAYAYEDEVEWEDGMTMAEWMDAQPVYTASNY